MTERRPESVVVDRYAPAVQGQDPRVRRAIKYGVRVWLHDGPKGGLGFTLRHGYSETEAQYVAGVLTKRLGVGTTDAGGEALERRLLAAMPAQECGDGTEGSAYKMGYSRGVRAALAARPPSVDRGALDQVGWVTLSDDGLPLWPSASAHEVDVERPDAVRVSLHRPALATPPEEAGGEIGRIVADVEASAADFAPPEEAPSEREAWDTDHPTYQEVRALLHDCAMKWRQVQQANARNTNGILGAASMDWMYYVDRLRTLLATHHTETPDGWCCADEANMQPEWTFCPICGSRLAPHTETERRLADLERPVGAQHFPRHTETSGEGA